MAAFLIVQTKQNCCLKFWKGFSYQNQLYPYTKSKNFLSFRMEDLIYEKFTETISRTNILLCNLIVRTMEICFYYYFDEAFST